MAKPALASALVALVAVGCGPKSGAGAAPASGPPWFVDVAASAGITAENHTGIKGDKDWVASAMGGGAIVLDYDGDGRMDLVVVDGTMLTAKGELEYDDAWRTRVFHNDGNWKFTETTKQCGVDVKAFGMGGAACDYDGDGRPDFLVCCWGRNYLFHNKGDGTFEEVAEKAGLAGAADKFSTSCAWGDVDGDGVPDVYVANYVDMRTVIETFRKHGTPGRDGRWRGLPVYPGPRGLPGQPHQLFLGNGDGTFRDVTATNLGPQPNARYGFQPVMTDLDNDGDLDIYVANDGVPNHLWINDGHGKFFDGGVQAGVAVDGHGEETSSMGVDVADVNRDGWLDLVVTNFAYEHSTLYVNRTTKLRGRSFEDASVAYNVAQPTMLRVAWGTRLWDYDGDGELDLFAACGQVYGDIPDFERNSGTSYPEPCLLMRGKGPPDYGFVDVSAAAGPAFAEKRVWRGAAFADFDDDGDLDVFVTSLNGKPALLRNDVGSKNGFLVLRLVGKGTGRDPCGARATLWLADGRPRVEELHHGCSYLCDNDPRLFFGLGAETSAGRLDVRWPDGTAQSFENVAGRKFYVLEEGAALREDVRPR